MIARLWRGRAETAKADAYLRHFTGSVVPELKHMAGHRGACSQHMAVGTRARDVERRGHWHEGLALQRAPDDLDEFIGQVRQVAQGLVLDLAVLAIAATQQVGAVDLVLVGARRSDDVSGAGTSCHQDKLSPNISPVV